MADRYWVGGSGTWSAASTTNWAASSGGASGASAPTTADNVIFDNNSNVGTGIFTVTISTASCLNMSFGTGASALDGVMTLAGTTGLTIAGSLTLPTTNLTITYTGAITFSATTTQTITTNGYILDSPITFNGVGGTWALIGNLTMSTATRTLTLTNGTFNANGYNVTIGLFSSSNSNTRALQMGGGVWTILGSGATAWSLATTTGMTLTNSNSMIDLTSTTAKTFAGGGLSYGTLRNSGSGALTITGANTFVNLRSVANTVFPGSATTTVTDGLSLNGRYGSLTYLRSSAGSATISKASGKVYTTFCNIANTTATGGATFRAPATPLTSYGNVDGGTNSGWTFIAIGATDNPNPGGFSSFFS